MELISMTIFVLEQEIQLRNDSDYTNQECLVKQFNYANFLKQPLELWMFVPCDENGYVLEIPTPRKGDDGNWNYQSRFEQYQQAKERCLFEGFEIVTKDFDKKPYKFMQNKDTYVAFLEPLSNEWKKVNDYECLEDLALYKFLLTPTAIKQLGL
jgi:hypothetical protein